MQRPKNSLSMRHLALNVFDLAASLHFYRDLLGMKVEWQPDENNVYLTSGNDNLALHKAKHVIDRQQLQSLDHLGFIAKNSAEVDAWYDFLSAKNVIIKAKPRQHRDGAYSFYCADPDGNLVQIIYHPPIS